MRRGLLCLLTLVAALPAAARAHPGPPPPPRPVVISPHDWSPEAAISDGSATCGACRETTARFVVINELHFGFNLRPEGNIDTLIWPVFATPRVLTQFEQMFARDNIAALLGKRVYCDCTGVRYRLADTGIFRITDARLFAR